jgi:hypothetical protein
MCTFLKKQIRLEYKATEIVVHEAGGVWKKFCCTFQEQIWKVEVICLLKPRARFSLRKNKYTRCKQLEVPPYQIYSHKLYTTSVKFSNRYRRNIRSSSEHGNDIPLRSPAPYLISHFCRLNLAPSSIVLRLHMCRLLTRNQGGPQLRYVAARPWVGSDGWACILSSTLTYTLFKGRENCL